LGNYAISYVAGTLTVGAKALTITANNTNKVYGSTITFSGAEFTSVGLTNSDSVSSVTLSSAGAAGAAPVAGSPYAITPSAAVGSGLGNYAIRYVAGTLTVGAKALTITANNTNKVYGAADPTFTVAYAGFVNGETTVVLGGTLTLTRAPGENVGSYLITPSGLTSANYAITFNTGTLTITAPAPLILTLTSAGTNNVVITWSAVSNATYRVQHKGLLSITNWTDLAGDVVAAGSTASKTDLKTTTNRFYRVQVVP
jgi:hypothetical protein